MLSKKAPVGETCSMKCRLLVFEKEMQVLVHVPSGSHDGIATPIPLGARFGVPGGGDGGGKRARIDSIPSGHVMLPHGRIALALV